MLNSSTRSAPELGRHELRLEVIEETARLLPLTDQWNGLVERAATRTVFQTFEWYLSWWRIFGAGARLRIGLAWEGDRLVGIAPLMVRQAWVGGLRLRVLEFIGTGPSDYADFIVEAERPAVLEALLGQLLRSDVDWELMALENLPAASPTAARLETFFGRQGLRLHRQIACECPAYCFGDRAEDEKVTRKKSLRRHFNYFQRTGQLEFQHCRDRDEILGLLDSFFDQHIRRRALTEDASSFHDEQRRAYYREMVQTLWPTGWLLFSVVRLDGRPIAFHLGFEYAGTMIWYKPTFEPELAQHSPGEVLIKYLFEDAIARGLREFDFTVGSEDFKYRFANTIRHNESIRVFRHAWLYLIDQGLDRCRTLIKRSPWLAKQSRRLMRLMRRNVGERLN